MRWFKTQVLDVLDKTGDRYIIIIDNAPYHSTSLKPKASNKKQVWYDFLVKHKAQLTPPVVVGPINMYYKWEIEEMVQSIVKKDGMQNSLYQVDKEAAVRGHKILRLPPYGCDLNVIEFVWKMIKEEVRKRNIHQNIKEIKKLAEEVLSKFGSCRSLQIKPFWDHVKKLEKRYWKEDGWFDEAMAQSPIIITEDDDDDEMLDEDDDSGVEGNDDNVTFDTCHSPIDIVHD
ncbi:uncharacterized protein LOC118438819 [Folsomia candida]|nr:uncharacterized protein LOC118438819 [Folsomia candida]